MSRKSILIYVISLGILLLGLYQSYRTNSLATTNPQFTVAEVIGKKEVGQSDYIEYKYLANGKIHVGRQGLTFKTKYKPIKGLKYLLVYNKKKPGKFSFLTGLKLSDSLALGSDLNNSYDIEILKKEGWITTFR